MDSGDKVACVFIGAVALITLVVAVGVMLSDQAKHRENMARIAASQPAPQVESK